MYQPDQGAVLIDGTDLRQIDPADVRRSIGCVLQDVFLFHGTIRDNIALGAPFADDQAVLRAARIAGVEDFVARHPLGFDLNVGERGERLSGGQRQAVAVARALLLDPPILVLDEPSSAMDNGAEGRLKQRLEQILPGKTLLLVTHRASLLSLVDRLIVLDGGRVVADGPQARRAEGARRRPDPGADLTWRAPPRLLLPPRPPRSGDCAGPGAPMPSSCSVAPAPICRSRAASPIFCCSRSSPSSPSSSPGRAGPSWRRLPGATAR